MYRFYAMISKNCNFISVFSLGASSCRGGAPLWLALTLALVTIFASLAQADLSNRSENLFDSLLVTAPVLWNPSEGSDLSLSDIGPQAVTDPRDQLIIEAERLAAKSYIPYVWGGRSISSAAVCNRCRACIEKNKLASFDNFKRLRSCSACKKCGLDCGHFVAKVFNSSGVYYRYADTALFRRLSSEVLWREHLLDARVLDDIDDLAPGDLILEQGHISLVVGVNRWSQTIDFVHASRKGEDSPVGGLEKVRDWPLERFFRSGKDPVVLRHREFLRRSETTRWLSQK
jgi:hypothetical protein